MVKVTVVILLVAAGVWMFWPASKAPDSNALSEPAGSGAVLAAAKPVPSEAPPASPVSRSVPAIASALAPAAAENQEAHGAETGDGKSGDDRNARIAALGFTAYTGRPSLGEAYRDRRGLVWGSVRKVDGATGFGDSTSVKVAQAEAEALCAKEGNRLPSVQDFEGFAADFGAKLAMDPFTDRVTFNGGYAPLLASTGELVLPTLTYQRVWTSTVDPKDSGQGFVFNGYYGYYGSAPRTWATAFLCVYDPGKKASPAK